MKFRFSYPLIALGTMMMTGLTVAAQSPDSERITTLLQHAREHSVKANLDAEQIDAFTRSKASWQSHSVQLRHMTDDVNELGKDMSDLTAARPEGSPWQQEAIDDVDPLLRSLADHMTAMIQHLKDNQTLVHMPPYVDYAGANYELSQTLLAMIDDYIGYAEAKAKTEFLERKLLLFPARVRVENSSVATRLASKQVVCRGCDRRNSNCSGGQRCARSVVRALNGGGCRAVQQFDF
jgi:hypothetical protein